MLENVFVTAIEGGSCYWYFIPAEEYDKIREAVPKEEEEAFSVALYHAVMGKGIEVNIHDAENEEEVLGVLRKDLITQRLALLAEDKEYDWALQAELDENGDAESSDVVFQYITMGEVCFA